RSRSDGHDLKKSPLVVASKSPIASPLLQPVDETRQAMPIDDVDFEMLEDAAEVEGDSPTVAATRKRTASNGESVAQVAANMGNEPAYVVPTTPSPFLSSSFPPQVPDFGYGYGMEMGLPPAYDGEDQVDYNEVAAMNAGFMQGMQGFLTPEMCPETFMQGMFMPYWQQMGMDGQMPCMDGQAMMTPELQEQLQKAAQMQEEYQQEQLAQVEPPQSQQEEPAPAQQEVEKETKEEKEASAAPATNGESRRSSREDAKWKDWKDSSWHDWQESSSKKDHDWKEHDWKDHAWKDNDWKDDWRRGGDDAYWKEASDTGSRRGSKGKSKGKEQRGWEEDRSGKDAEWAQAGTSSRNKAPPEEPRQSAGADPSTKEKKIPPIPYERPEGNEPYTTVMLRNIPNKYTREMLIKQLSLEFTGEFDFMYLPIDFKNKCNVGYGFINFRTQDSCERFIGLFHGVDVRKCLPGLNSKKVVEVTPARVQGLTENVRRLRNSPVMNQLQDHPEWMPLLFDENGIDQPFPLPDQPLPPVKPRGRNREAAAPS
ncbi:ML2, partial [Symbiodinium pilosum]